MSAEEEESQSFQSIWDNIPFTTKMHTLILLIVNIYAIYLSFKCNNGFSLIGFLLSYIFGPCYIIYAYLFNYEKCFK